MSENDNNDWDEEEEDFVPEEYEDADEEGDNYDDQDDDGDDPEAFPSLLQGEISMDRTKGLCYEQEGVFCLVCKTSFPAQSFDLDAPVIDTPLVFSGWINDPNRRMEFEVMFSKEPMSNDPLQIQILEAQEKKQVCNGSPTTAKTSNDFIDDNWMEKKSPAKEALKDPPPYTSNEKSGSFKASVNEYNPKTSSSNLKAGNAIETSEGKTSHLEFSNKGASTSGNTENDMKCTKQIIVVSGSQINNDNIDDSRISFRGAYRCPSKVSMERIYLICPIQTTVGAKSTSAAGSTAATAVASKKRNRSNNHDDDSVEGGDGVAYQELIDLHEDTRLSTEELRKRYYGTGVERGECGNERVDDNKRMKGAGNRNNQKYDIEEDDDEDAFGF